MEVMRVTFNIRGKLRLLGLLLLVGVFLFLVDPYELLEESFVVELDNDTVVIFVDPDTLHGQSLFEDLC